MKNITKISKNLFLKYSPTIFTIAGAAGVVVVSIFSAQATPKAMELIEKKEELKGAELSKGEKFITAAPAYYKTAIAEVITIACIFGSNAVNRKNQAILMASYALLEKYHKAYRNNVVRFHGEEADKTIQTALAREFPDICRLDLDSPDQKVLFIDPISGRKFMRYEREVMDAEYHLNRNFTMRGYCCLNEFYEFLGLDLTREGEDLGWSVDSGIQWIDFMHKLEVTDEGDSIYTIHYIFGPDEDYMEGWN